MKRIFAFLSIACSLMGCRVQDYFPSSSVKGDLCKYSYFYVVPTNGVTSDFGTISPSEIVSGYLMQKGYNVLSSESPELIDKTLAVTYGVIGNGIIIQMKDAKTQELVASYKVDGFYVGAASQIREATYKALEMYEYSCAPEIEVGFNFSKVYKNGMSIYAINKTPNVVNQIDLRITYYLEGAFVHEQKTTIGNNLYLNPGYEIRKYIKRDKEARSKKYQIKLEVLSYQ